jgi:fumarate reductase iron-sulfur subunit
MARRLQFDIFRYNPQDPDSTPHTDTFYLDETDSMTILSR